MTGQTTILPRQPIGRLRGADGFTLIELLVTMTAGLIILGAVLVPLIGATTHEAGNEARYESLHDTSAALERLTREVRESVSVTGVTDRYVRLSVWKRDPAGATASVLHDVRYDCSNAGSVAGTYACRRTDATTGVTTTVVDRLTSPSVFTTVAGQPDLQIALSIAVDKAVNPIVVRGGASPRNCTGALSSCTGT